jgi:hypothetical protein
MACDFAQLRDADAEGLILWRCRRCGSRVTGRLATPPRKNCRRQTRPVPADPATAETPCPPATSAEPAVKLMRARLAVWVAEERIDAARAAEHPRLLAICEACPLGHYDAAAGCTRRGSACSAWSRWGEALAVGWCEPWGERPTSDARES